VARTACDLRGAGEEVNSATAERSYSFHCKLRGRTCPIDCAAHVWTEAAAGWGFDAIAPSFHHVPPERKAAKRTRPDGLGITANAPVSDISASEARSWCATLFSEKKAGFSHLLRSNLMRTHSDWLSEL